MGNVLDDTTQRQILALGRLRWTLSRIQRTTGVRRETISGYLKAAGIPVRGRGRPSESKPKAAISEEVSTDSHRPKPATTPEVSTDLAAVAPDRHSIPAASERFRDQLSVGLARARTRRAARPDVLAHYGVVGLPCRVGDPDRKGKVESGIGHTQKTPLQGMRFETLEEAQTYLDRWDARWADTRIHGTTKRQVAAMFAEEQPALRPLPLEPFRYYHFGVRTVHLDGCVEVDAAYYSAPPGWIGRRVDVQWTDLHVRLLNPKTGQLLREHVGAPRGWHRIEDVDRPGRTPAKTLALLTAANRVGPSVGAVVDHIHRHDGAGGVRRILVVLALAKKYGPAVVEDAATAALDLAVPTYRFLRRYLERRPPVPLTLRQVDPLIRQLTLYRDLIDRTTGDSE